jgi:putative transposase
MARQLRFDIAGNPQHVIQRGNNREACFFAEADYAAYLHWLHEGAQHHGVAIHAYCLMTNHVHLLVTPESAGAVSRLMQHVGRHYVNYANKVYRRSGTLWEGRFKSCLVDSEAYLLKLYQYIEYNPVRAGMVVHPEDYRWSSYQRHGCAEAMAYLSVTNATNNSALHYRSAPRPIVMRASKCSMRRNWIRSGRQPTRALCLARSGSRIRLSRQCSGARVPDWAGGPARKRT